MTSNFYSKYTFGLNEIYLQDLKNFKSSFPLLTNFISNGIELQFKGKKNPKASSLLWKEETLTDLQAYALQV